jgi:hypothetical protein
MFCPVKGQVFAILDHDKNGNETHTFKQVENNASDPFALKNVNAGTPPTPYFTYYDDVTQTFNRCQNDDCLKGTLTLGATGAGAGAGAVSKKEIQIKIDIQNKKLELDGTNLLDQTLLSRRTTEVKGDITSTKKIEYSFKKRTMYRQDGLSNFIDRYGASQHVIYGQIGYTDDKGFTGYKIVQFEKELRGIFQVFKEGELIKVYVGGLIGFVPNGIGAVYNSPSLNYERCRGHYENSSFKNNLCDRPQNAFETSALTTFIATIKQDYHLQDFKKGDKNIKITGIDGGQRDWKETIKEYLIQISRSKHNKGQLVRLHAALADFLHQKNKDLYKDLTSCQSYKTQGQEMERCLGRIKKELDLVNMLKFGCREIARQQQIPDNYFGF